MNAPSSIEGLTDAEADHVRALVGANTLPAPKRRTIALAFIEILREPMFALLVAAALLYVLLGKWTEGVFMTLGAACAIGLVLFQQARSERALAALQSLAEPTARVVRDGAVVQRRWSLLVPGDVICISEGDRVPADAILFQGGTVRADESMLTGESIPVVKRSPSDLKVKDPSETTLFAGTMIVQGAAHACVTETGPRSAMGRIGLALQKGNETPTPLQRSATRVVRLLGAVAILYCVMIALIYATLRDDWFGGVLSGITAAIALIPEEFPMVMTVFLALGAWRMSRHNVLVRRNAVIETLGAVSVLCVDKTGTLTENHMKLARIWTPIDGAMDVGDDLPVAAQTLLVVGKEASQNPPSDPMDRAILAAPPSASASARPVHTWPLTAKRAVFAQARLNLNGALVIAAKGAPETMLPVCALSESTQNEAIRVLKALASQGYRCLAVARATPDALPADLESAQFEFLGLLAFLDPLRADVPAAVAEARGAGVRVVMLTGDHPETAGSIARAAGIDATNRVVLGRDFSQRDPAARLDTLNQFSIFARVAPEHKLLLVDALQTQGHVVAMTGDGINDAPALKAADVGIAMGKKGADVAREASDLVLLDDSFPSIVHGIRLGRRIFANLRRALIFITAAHVPVAGLALSPLLLGWPPLLFPMHVVMLELAIDPICALVFENEPSERAFMSVPPRSKTASLFSARELTYAIAQGLSVLLAVLFVYAQALAATTPETARGAGFASLIIGALTLALANAAGSGGALFARHRFVFWSIFLALTGAIALIFTAPVAQTAFSMRLPAPSILLESIFLGIVGGLTPFLIVQAYLFFRSEPSSSPQREPFDAQQNA